MCRQNLWRYGCLERNDSGAVRLAPLARWWSIMRALRQPLPSPPIGPLQSKAPRRCLQGRGDGMLGRAPDAQGLADQGPVGQRNEQYGDVSDKRHPHPEAKNLGAGEVPALVHDQ